MCTWRHHWTPSPTEPRSSSAVAARAGHAALVALVLFGLFGVIACATLRGGWFETVDAQVAAALAAHVGTGMRAFLGAVSALHAPRAIVVWTAIALVVLLGRRDGGGAVLLLTSVFGGATLNHLFKHGFMRARPGLEQVLAAATDFSFPSGHVANATLLYGVLVILAWHHLPAGPRRAVALLSAALLVTLVACSRLALGAHRLSDVLAAVPLALGWLALCLAGAAALRAACAAARAGHR